ncbi:MAG: DUF2070 family protein [Candidatus Micrarchaeaceae archaeon]
MPRGSEDPLGNNIFLKSIPSAYLLLVLLLIIGIFVGIGAVAIMGHQLEYGIAELVVKGIITGTLVLAVPTLLTVIIFKSIKRYILLKYILFISLIGASAYSVFLLLGNALYAISRNYALASAIILVGDASIFGWWFFITKVLLGKQKSGIALSIVQPTLNVLIYIPYSKFIFSFSTPLKILLVKLYAAIFIFLVMSYMILYIFNRPFKKSMGFQAIDTMSQFVQNWLFNIDVNPPFGISRIGVNAEINVDTFVFRHGSSTKAIFFIPGIHYGPMGTLGGSNFPYLLEKYAVSAYRAPSFIMHTAVNLDNNPVATSQISQMYGAMRATVEKCSSRAKSVSTCFYSGRYKNSEISVISFGDDALATFSRAPRVTEDIDPSVAKIFRSKLEGRFKNVALIDAHNSRYESAPKSELAGATMYSRITNEYMEAISRLSKPLHKSRSVRMGVASVELFNALGRPKDIAPGNLNVAVFVFNGFKHAIIQFNANNMLPQLRTKIVGHLEKEFGLHAEVCTTDTHVVNALDLDASNVIGRHSSHSAILRYVDKAVKKALSNIEEVEVCYSAYKIKNFKIWGSSSKERISAVLKSVYEVAKILVPVIIAGAFIIAILTILAI